MGLNIQQVKMQQGFNTKGVLTKNTEYREKRTSTMKIFNLFLPQFPHLSKEEK